MPHIAIRDILDNFGADGFPFFYIENILNILSAKTAENKVLQLDCYFDKMLHTPGSGKEPGTHSVHMRLTFHRDRILSLHIRVLVTSRKCNASRQTYERDIAAAFSSVR